MSQPSDRTSEADEVAALIAPYKGVRGTVAPWLAGFAVGGTRRGHNVIWIWSEDNAFPSQSFAQRDRADRIAALRRFLSSLPKQRET